MKAPCPYYRKCSGCMRLADPYVRQLFVKNRDLTKRFGQLGYIQDHVLQKTVPSPAPFEYRSSSKLSLHQDGLGRRAIGLYKLGTKVVFDIPECPVHEPGINRLLKQMFYASPPLPAPFYNHTKKAFQPGRLKFITIRRSATTGEAGVIISHTGVPKNELRGWFNKLRLSGCSVFATELSPNDRDLILSSQIEHLYGPETFQFRLAGIDFALPPLAFFQANGALADQFVSYISEGFQSPSPLSSVKDPKSSLSKAGTLLDLYGGFGAYSFVAAPAFERMIVVDGNQAAISAGVQNAKRLGVPGLRLVHASIENFLKNQLKPHERSDVTRLIVNPPRSGLSNHVKEMLAPRLFPSANRLTYVSCNKETLIRDLDTLVKKHRWQIAKIQPFDMFPQTDHIEVVVDMVLSACLKTTR